MAHIRKNCQNNSPKQIIRSDMIPLYFCNGQASIWNANDWVKLRTEHRIIGELIGTIATLPRQDTYQGFPMILMPEQAALLVKNGTCKLVQYTNLNEIPSEEFVKLSEEIEEKLYSEQIECMKEKRINQISLKIDMIIAGKKKKLSNKGVSSELNREVLIQEEIQKVAPLSVENSLVQIPTEHPWPHNLEDVSIDQLVPSVTSNIGKIKYAVFNDLWNKGFYVTAGTKFGGDFLVYLGDPVKFHAISVVKCMKSAEEKMKLSEIVAFGRLGVSVNKLTVYAYLDNDSNVTYQTLQWHDTLY